MFKKNLMLKIAIFLFISLVLNAYADEECPLILSSTNQKLNVDIPGWSAIEDDIQHELTAVTISDGHPQELHGVIPDGDRRAKVNNKEFSMVYWDLEQTDEIQYWIKCSYNGTKISLTKKITGSHVHCESAKRVFNNVVHSTIAANKCAPVNK